MKYFAHLQNTITQDYKGLEMEKLKETTELKEKIKMLEKRELELQSVLVKEMCTQELEKSELEAKVALTQIALNNYEDEIKTLVEKNDALKKSKQELQSYILKKTTAQEREKVELEN